MILLCSHIKAKAPKWKSELIMDYLLKTYMNTGLLEYFELLGSEEDLKLRQYFAECANMENCGGPILRGLEQEACD